MEDKDFDIAEKYKALAENELRNKLIVSDVLAAIESDRTPIVLTQRANHVNILAEV